MILPGRLVAFENNPGLGDALPEPFPHQLEVLFHKGRNGLQHFQVIPDLIVIRKGPDPVIQVQVKSLVRLYWIQMHSEAIPIDLVLERKPKQFP